MQIEIFSFSENKLRSLHKSAFFFFFFCNFHQRRQGRWREGERRSLAVVLPVMQDPDQSYNVLMILHAVINILMISHAVINVQSRPTGRETIRSRKALHIAFLSDLQFVFCNRKYYINNDIRCRETVSTDLLCYLTRRKVC